MVEGRTGEMRGRNWPLAVSIAIGIAGVTWPKASAPLFAWNGSHSVPAGLYVIAAHPPARGELAVLRLPEPMRSLVDARGYLPAYAVLIKPVAALAPDLVCRSGAIITINGQRVALAMTADASARPLPQWSGCHKIEDRQLFALSDEQHSFDSRYFGLVDARHVIGTAVAVWTAEQLPKSGGGPTNNLAEKRSRALPDQQELPRIRNN